MRARSSKEGSGRGPRMVSLPMAVALLLSVVTVVLGGPAAAATDGPPNLTDTFTPTPQVFRPAGGGAVRIYGSGFLGTTSVKFFVGTGAGRTEVVSPGFTVVDGTLILAKVPAANPAWLVQNDGFAHISITDDQGTGTTDLDGDGIVDLSDCSSGCAAFGPEIGAVFYTDATLTVTPSTGLDGGEIATMNVTGHRPNQGGWPFVQLNPLVNFLEQGPQDPDVAPPGPPYGAPLAFAPTDGNGNTGPVNVNVSASPTFNAKDQDYDADADCPVAQITADYGLDKCILGYSEFGMASLEHYVSFSPDAPNLDPVPAAPTLTVGTNSGLAGATATLSGIHWNAAPHFGSSTSPTGPGQSAVLIDLCTIGQTSCTPATGTANVSITRYHDADPTNPCVSGASPPCIQPSYSGATLSGSFTVPSTAGCAPSCVVRVRQQRYDIEANAPVAGTYITAVAPLAPSTYAPVSPFRIWDSRGGSGPPGAVGPGGTRDLTVTGLGGVPATGVTAVVLNVTAVNPTAPTYVTVWPTGETQPLASNLNVPPNDVRANLVIVKVGAGGQVSFANAAGNVNLIADVAGWYGPTAGQRYTAVSPSRVWDSRGTPGPTGALGPGASRTITVTGVGGVPATGVTAVVLNVTAVTPSAATYITAWPTGETQPLASNLNVPPGDVRPNLVIVKVGAGGQVSFVNAAGNVHLIADVAGYYSATGSSFTSVSPARLWDSRGTPGPTGAVGPGGTRAITVTGVGGVPATGVTAVVLNVTAVNPTADTYVTVWPTGETQPLASNLNVPPNDVRANLVIVKVGAGGQVSFSNAAGNVHLIADVAGWYGAAGA